MNNHNPSECQVCKKEEVVWVQIIHRHVNLSDGIERSMLRSELRDWSCFASAGILEDKQVADLNHIKQILDVILRMNGEDWDFTTPIISRNGWLNALDYDPIRDIWIATEKAIGTLAIPVFLEFENEFKKMFGK